MIYLPMHQHLQVKRSSKARQFKFNKLLCDECGYRSVLRVERVPMHWEMLPVGECYCKCEQCGAISTLPTADWYKEQEREAHQTGKRDRV